MGRGGERSEFADSPRTRVAAESRIGVERALKLELEPIADRVAIRDELGTRARARQTRVLLGKVTSSSASRERQLKQIRWENSPEKGERGRAFPAGQVPEYKFRDSERA